MKVTLNQKAEFTLAGVTLLSGENTLTALEYGALKEQWGYTNALEIGLIEEAKPEKPSPSEKPKKTKK